MTMADLFDMSGVERLFGTYTRVVAESFGRLYPRLCEEYSAMERDVRSRMTEVGRRFVAQAQGMWQPDCALLDDPAFATRINKGASYFLDELANIATLLTRTPASADNKTLEERLANRRDELEEHMRMKTALLKIFSTEPFSVGRYVTEKGKLLAGNTGGGKIRDRKEKKDRHAVADEVENPELFERLTEWRRKEGERLGCPNFMILSTRCLKEIAAVQPQSLRELLKVAGIGKKKAEDFGSAILQITTHPDFRK